jgi:hypothetical protein
VPDRFVAEARANGTDSVSGTGVRGTVLHVRLREEISAAIADMRGRKESPVDWNARLPSSGG